MLAQPPDTHATPVTHDDRLDPVVINAGADAGAVGVRVFARATPARRRKKESRSP